MYRDKQKGFFSEREKSPFLWYLLGESCYFFDF